jgi:hypothetical protein
MNHRRTRRARVRVLATFVCLAGAAAPAGAQHRSALPTPAIVTLPAPTARRATTIEPCPPVDFATLGRNATARELRCRFGVLADPGRFGLLSYADVPVYQPATPMPGTHVIGVAGLPHPAIGESYEAWEWRVLRTGYGPEALGVHRGLEVLDPFVATRLLRFEARLAEEGIRAVRRETWRAPQRQAYLFQQGRSRPGPLATATLTSWHCAVDAHGRPAGRAADYSVRAADLPRFHELAAEVGLESFGADSHDPGHVFLPDSGSVTQRELALLRVLPRVPHVTLATGRPYDEPAAPERRALLREAARDFAGEVFFPARRAVIVGPERLELPWADSVRVPERARHEPRRSRGWLRR